MLHSPSVLYDVAVKEIPANPLIRNTPEMKQKEMIGFKSTFDQLEALSFQNYRIFYILYYYHALATLENNDGIQCIAGPFFIVIDH